MKRYSIYIFLFTVFSIASGDYEVFAQTVPDTVVAADTVPAYFPLIHDTIVDADTTVPAVVPPASDISESIEKKLADTIPVSFPSVIDTVVAADTAAPVTIEGIENFFTDTVSVSPPPVPDSVVAADTIAPAVQPKTSNSKPRTSVAHSVIIMEFVKEKATHSPDSLFFNVLKITNNNAKPVQGVVRITVPIGWKLISEDESVVNILPGSSEYVPIRVALARTVTGGVTYLINATLYSNRMLFPDKNQTSIGKACYITIPKKRKWEIIPVQRTVYFNRYTEYAPLKLRVINKGNGNEVIKMELNMGSALVMYGVHGNKHFTSVELKPQSDTVIFFPIKYLPPDESDLWSRDFRKFMVGITASSDTIIKRTSVNFKYLESVFNNTLAEGVSPLAIDVQLQNLLADVPPRVIFSANGNIYFKNEHTINYDLRLPGFLFSGNNFSNSPGDALWKYSRFHVHYNANRWATFAGDINSSGIGMIGTGGRGIGGSYRINKKNKISAAFAARVSNSIYSGNVQHETVLPKNIKIASALSFIADDYNKINTLGFAVQSGYSFFKGHFLSVLLAATQTRHLYDNQTFLDPSGNFITTHDPDAAFYGAGARVGYSVRRKRLRVNVNSFYSSKHFSQYQNGRFRVYGNGSYSFNNKYQLIGGVNYNTEDPLIYNRGIVNPERQLTTGRYSMEIADRINSKLMLFAGPVFDHSNRRQLKIISNGDSMVTRFSTASPQLSFRLNFRNNSYSSISPYMLTGYTIVTAAVDSTIGSPDPGSTNSFFNTNVGVNIAQKNWGVNVAYYTGPYNMETQSNYYYFGSYSKSIRIMPYFQKYYFHKKLLISSNDSYYYQVHSNSERITLNARLSGFFNHGWTLFVDNNLSMFSRVSSEGQKAYNRVYSLNLGFHKSFDIPQPGVKYYDLKVICFKDINGNGVMDADEQGIEDVVITIDRQSQMDSITKKSVKQRGYFSPAEMATDVFGQVVYYHIPQGEFNISVFPLINLEDVFNVKGQKQDITISGDTTYYIPFVQSYRVTGRVILERDEYSSSGLVSTANIRITATDSLDNSFPTLTIGDGSYILYVPQAGEYKVTINNVFSDRFVLAEPEYTVSFDGAKEFHVDFIFSEKKRKINIASTDTAAVVRAGDTIKVGPKNVFIYSENTVFDIDTINTIRTDTIRTVSMDTIKNLTVITDTIFAETTPGKFQQYYYSLPVAPGVSYRVQIATSSNRLTPSQRATKFKGVSNVAEYVENSVYKYTVGDFSSIDDAKKLKANLRAKGYKDAFLVPFYDNKRVRNK